jgi:hypothetical protein
MRPRTVGNALGLLMTLGALFCVVHVLFTNRHGGTVGWILVVAAAICVVATVCRPRAWGMLLFATLGLTACGAVLWEMAAPSLADLERDGDRMIAAFEQYRRDHGQYPATADEAGVTLPETRFGRWQYRPEPDGREFALSIGDYGEDLFVLLYDSRTGRWSADT